MSAPLSQGKGFLVGESFLVELNLINQVGNTVFVF